MIALDAYGFVSTFQPDKWDYLGAALCLIGVAIIMYAPRR